jgi:hypothetical protein
MADISSSQASPFACDMNAIDPEYRDRHISTTIELFQSVQTIRDLPNGYTFRFPNETGLLLKSAEFIAYERLCCPFFGFALEIEPEGGAVWLHLTGPEGVKPFIRAEIGAALNDAVVQAANFR